MLSVSVSMTLMSSSERSQAAGKNKRKDKYLTVFKVLGYPKSFTMDWGGGGGMRRVRHTTYQDNFRKMC
jgi:hypothetical protein